MASTLLEMDETALLFFPSDRAAVGAEEEEPTDASEVSIVVQVHVVSSQTTKKYRTVAERKANETHNIWATFYRFQEEITKAIRAVVSLHLYCHASLDAYERIEVEGDGFKLYLERKEWRLGKKLMLMWGEESVWCAREKWRVELEVLP